MMHLDIDIFRDPFKTTFVPFEMEVYKYMPNDFDKRAKVVEDDLQLDIIDISYFTARTLCSYHLSQRELYFDIIASLLSHLNFIDATKTSLLLSESRYKRLRDFSKSSRIGEMAQGINSYFVSKRLNFPYIIDFDLAKNKTHAFLNIQSNGKSPDFVVLDSTMTKIGLFESKGNMNGNARGDLIGAMSQLNDVVSPCFDSKIPVSTRFQDNNDYSKKNLRKVRKSSINYALIEKACTTPKEAELLRKLHYASWFYLVGDFGRVDSILNDGVIAPIENDPIYILDIETDKRNPIYWVAQPMNLSVNDDDIGTEIHLFITARYSHIGEYKIGIYKSVIDQISKNGNVVFELPEGNVDSLRKFPDGTLLYLRANK